MNIGNTFNINEINYGTSLGTLVEIRGLHLGVSWEHIGSNNKINGSKHDKDMTFHF